MLTLIILSLFLVLLIYIIITNKPNNFTNPTTSYPNPLPTIVKSINDPQVGIDRKCNKITAMNQFLEDVYNFNISEENKTAENLNKDLDIYTIQEKIPEYLKQYNNSLADFLGDKNPGNDPTKEQIKNAINNYIKNASPDELVNYTQELCMINEYVDENTGIKSLGNNTGSFYDNYISINDIEDRIYTLEPVKVKINHITGKKTVYKGENLANEEELGEGDIRTVDEEIVEELVRVPGKVYTDDALNNKKDTKALLMTEVWNLNKPITGVMMNKMFNV